MNAVLVLIASPALCSPVLMRRAERAVSDHARR